MTLLTVDRSFVNSTGIDAHLSPVCGPVSRDPTEAGCAREVSQLFLQLLLSHWASLLNGS